MRALLAALGASAALPGLWATFAPHSFYDRFPGPWSWVAELPAYSPHLVTDVGAFYLAFALLFAWAALRPSRELVVPLACAWGLFSVLHLTFHVLHLDGFGVVDGVAQTASLVAVLAGTFVLLALTRAEQRG